MRVSSPGKLRPWHAVLALVVVVAAVVIGVRVWHRGNELQQAMALMPDQGGRYSWTDWSAVREELHAHVDASSTRGQVKSFLDQAWDRDLTSSSALTDAGGLLQTAFGFSPASLDWELFTQTTDGQVMIGKLSGDDAADRVEQSLRRTGFHPPSGDDDVWSSKGVDLAGIDSSSTPLEILDYVAVVPGRDLVVTGDNPIYLQRTVDHLGDGDPPQAMDAAAGSLDDPVAATITSESVACPKMSIEDAGATDTSQADRLVADAGTVNPYEAIAMAELPGRRNARISMVFADHDQAVRNADSRATLAAGPAPMQGGSFTDMFTVGQVAAEDDIVEMDLHPKSDVQLVEDLRSGSVLFATC